MTSVNALKELFKDKALFDQSLTHKSWVNENKRLRESNERLEYLGDAVLEFVVSKALFGRFSSQPEGYLTALRANLVNTKNLAQVAKKLDLGSALFLSKGEEDGGGRENDSLLADTVEAVIGAIYVDQGINAAAKFIKINLLSEIEEKLKEPLKDAKSRLQEHMQAKGFLTPLYKVTKEIGPDHNKRFTVEVSIQEKNESKPQLVGRGEGGSKMEAQQQAAQDALEKVA